MRLHAYLTFTGNCRPAMEFYQRIFGGELQVQTLQDSPDAMRFSPSDQRLIVQATLSATDWKLMGSDLSDAPGNGQSVLLAMQCESAFEMQYRFKQLAASGNIWYPPQQNKYGHWNAECTDRYGKRWMLYVI
ncbi:MAG TPA: VOC family protein [Ferruginibacter sp.]|nr:VOC family protein [Ferruginibacter sp.]